MNKPYTSSRSNDPLWSKYPIKRSAVEQVVECNDTVFTHNLTWLKYDFLTKRYMLSKLDYHDSRMISVRENGAPAEMQIPLIYLWPTEYVCKHSFPNFNQVFTSDETVIIFEKGMVQAQMTFLHVKNNQNPPNIDPVWYENPSQLGQSIRSSPLAVHFTNLDWKGRKETLYYSNMHDLDYI